MKRHLSGGLMLLSLLTGCTASITSQPPPDPDIMLSPVVLDNTVKLVAGQTVYVPVYSSIYTWEQSRTMNLTTTLSVRNTDLTHPMIITAVRYHGDDGKLIRNYLQQPGQLASLASASFVVDQEDTSGGLGAAFIVEWVAQQQISAPVIEAVMVSTMGNQGISLISPGRVIQNRTEGS